MSQVSGSDRQQVASSVDQDARDARTVVMSRTDGGQVCLGDLADDVLPRVEAVSQMLHQAAGGESRAGAVDGECDNEPSIEEYMAALMARSRDPRSSERPRSVIMAPVPPPPPPRQQPVPAAPPFDTYNSVTEGRQTPPECRDAISEMRELANLSTRSTVTVHYAQQLVYAMYNKFIVALVALVISLALTCLASEVRSVTFCGALAALVVAVYWTLQYFHFGRQLQKLHLPRLEDE